MRQYVSRARVVDVMEEAVGQDQVKAVVGRDVKSRDVGHDEFAPVSSPCALDVRRVEVDAEVIRARKVMCVRAGPAANVEDAARAPYIIVREKRQKLPLSERGLPYTVGERVLENPRVQLHGRHRT